MAVTNASSLAPPTEYTAFMLLTALPEWLSLTRAERRRVADAALGAALDGRTRTTMRFFDAEAFSARCSDVAVFTTTDLAEYYLVIEALRDSALFTVPYFRLDDLILSVEDGHRAAG
ncbi:darcynin family protein [Nocardia thailandica]|uniref:darcynin family protein n=1 Tax=Nocardia thailandica TaxID=257275 RepID=UPI000694A6B1|nr:darcynin family protein [Nocardia thailandica]